MTDNFNVTAAYDKSSYNQGETMKVTISGDDVQTVTNTAPSGVLTLTLLAADGATTTITAPASSITTVTSSHLSVKITAVSDPSGRTWAIAADGLSATAVA